MLALESQHVFQNLLLFCFAIIITNYLMTGPLGNSEFCFPLISMFPLTNSEILGKQIHCSPQDRSLSVNYLVMLLLLMLLSLLLLQLLLPLLYIHLS